MNRDPMTFDVVIAGAGLAGSSLALRLAEAGARVGLADPGVFPREKLCGEYLSPEGAAVLDRLGMLPDLERRGSRPIDRVRLTTPRGRSLAAKVTGDDARPGLGLSRATLDDHLINECRRAGVTVMEQTRVAGPILEDGRVAGVRARCANHEPLDLLATVTIAANGRHSSLVRETGTTRARGFSRPGLFGLKRHYACSDLDASEPDGTVGLHLVPGGYIGACRIDGGLINVCGLLPEAILKQYRGDLDRLADEHFAANPVLDRLIKSSSPTSPWKTVAGVRVEVSTPKIPGILYAGDCQGTVDPLGGQGMTMALLGAEMLAPVALSALHLGEANHRLQQAHQAAWRRRFDGRIRLCRLFHHMLINPWLIDAAAVSGTIAPRLLTACFQMTRDRSIVAS